MSDTNIATIHEYFRCFKDKDRARLTEILVPGFIHCSPYGRYDDRDAMLDDIWPHVGGIFAVDVQVFGQGDEYMVRYQHTGNSTARMAEWFRFEGGRIAEIEVYAGAGGTAAPER